MAEYELPEARRSKKGAKPVDGHPWIWNDFAAKGYSTMWIEDDPGIGTFTYRMLGFKDQPTDYYGRVQWLARRKSQRNITDFIIIFNKDPVYKDIRVRFFSKLRTF